MSPSQRGGPGRPSVDPSANPPGGALPPGELSLGTYGSEPPRIEFGEGWGRRRIIFLTLSALFALAVMWLTREVILPFILAIIIAYVFTPLVGWCERRGLHRAVSIIAVYLGTFAVLSTTVALIAPRIYRETLGLTRESPQIARRLATQWGPVIESRIESMIEMVGGSP